MEQILSNTSKTATTIMMINKNMKVKVRLPDGVTNLFDIVAGVLQGDNIDRSNK